MSGHECFYCDRKLTEREQEVDHYVEVAERDQDAFVWENLCLSCSTCNSDKASNRTHPVSAALDPSVPGAPAGDHLGFEGQYTGVRDGSLLRGATIRKYDLDPHDLKRARLNARQKLCDAVIAVCLRAQAEGRTITSDERSIIKSLADPSRPFSLMMHAKLARLGCRAISSRHRCESLSAW